MFTFEKYLPLSFQTNLLYLKVSFTLPVSSDESVLGMTSDEDNKQLITGDTKGHVIVWAIEEHCIKPTEKVGLQLVSPKTERKK